MSADKRQRIRRRLAAWYRRCRRDLPWRRTTDPYAVWVSEIMLQQTRVATVIPYYRRFLRRFPTIGALARAREQTALKLWEGLGYYARARNMRRAARHVVAEHGGRLPDTLQGLLSLPGIGRYTAGAIASIAFGLDEPVLDGNVERVLCRAFLVRGDPRRAAAKKRLWTIARDLLPRGKASLFNQALMDLGATVCTPHKPLCASCPIAGECEALRQGEQESLPRRRKAPRSPHYEIAAGVIRRGSRILIARRKDDGLLGGLWEFPGGKREKGETLQECVAREVFEELRVKVQALRPIVTVRHAYSHFRVTLHAFDCRYLSGRPQAIGCAAWKWVRIDDLAKYPFPRANRKILAALRSAGDG